MPVIASPQGRRDGRRRRSGRRAADKSDVQLRLVSREQHRVVGAGSCRCEEHAVRRHWRIVGGKQGNESDCQEQLHDVLE
jgi:hypothetical protein